MGAATSYWWQGNITVCIYEVIYLGLGVQKRCPGGGHKDLLAYTLRTEGRRRLRARLG